MCLQTHLLIVVIVAILVSSFSSFCLSSYPFPEHGIANYATNTSDQDKKAPNYYELGLQNLVGYKRDIVDDVIIPLRRPLGRARSESLALAPAPSPRRIVSVDDYLVSDRKSDATEAFRKAWKEACSSDDGVFLVPKNKRYRVKPINFSGPCRSRFKIKMLGTIEASVNVSDYKDRRYWLVFENIRNFQVEGGGTIDGNGDIWWQNSCKINKTKPCTHAPTAVTFLGCKNFKVDGLRIRNAQQMHLSFQRCAVVRATNLDINAPGHSPNTDGDDCISIVSGSKNVEAMDITCGPGHGISIGSLGKGQSKAHVSNVLVNRARLSGTTNGVRIKTWQGGRGYVKNVVFENISMQNVSNPIIIDQHYCDQAKPCQQMKTAVQIHNVVYKNIKGTSATEVAIKLDCSKRHRCGGIVLQDVKLVRAVRKKEAKADCHNARLFHRGTVSPRCLQTTLD